MARMRDRLFAGFGAILFLASASTLTILVILNPGSDTTANDTASTADCMIASVAGTAEAAPEVYKPDGDVTALQTTDLTTGSGKEAKSGSCIEVKYYGTLASDGTMFDEDFTQANNLKFTLGQRQVIPGWDQGVVGMKEGGVRRLVIPSDLAYGESGNGPKIPANADLVFVVKLVKVDK